MREIKKIKIQYETIDKGIAHKKGAFDYQQVTPNLTPCNWEMMCCHISNNQQLGNITTKEKKFEKIVLLIKCPREKY